jgi:CRP/FNR family cyclic AMP-dependent transcriptional regulator
VTVEPSGVDRRAEDEQLLRATPMFASLDASAADELAAKFDYVQASAGTVVLHEGEPADFYLLLSGKVKVYRHTRSAREAIVNVTGPGAQFGPALVFDTGARTTAVQAMTDVRLARVATAVIHAWVCERPRLIVEMIDVLTRQLESMDDTIADLMFDDVAGRVAKQVLALADKFGQVRDGELLVDHGLTQMELAQLVVATREGTNKVLADFERRGWIRVKRRGVVIIDRERLVRRTRQGQRAAVIEDGRPPSSLQAVS